MSYTFTVRCLFAFVQVTTLVEGNEVGGSFYLNDTDAIASDATAEEMEILLEATDLGDVNVTRSEESDGRGGYSWSVTFLGYVGDVPALVADNDLTGYSATISVVEVRTGIKKWGREDLHAQWYVLRGGKADGNCPAQAHGKRVGAQVSGYLEGLPWTRSSN